MKSTIYKLYFEGTDHVYVGQSTQPDRRKKDHVRALRRGKHINSKLQSVFNKYGENTLQFEVLEVCDKKQATEREQYWIDHIGSLNLAPANFPLSFTDDQRRKLSKAMTGKKLSSAHKKAISLGHASTPVYALNFITGEVLKKYRSIRAAARDSGVNSASISSALQSPYTRQVADRAWIAVDDYVSPEEFLRLREEAQDRYQHIYCVDLDNNVIAEYGSIAEAALCLDAAHAAINTAIKTAGISMGYRWCYATKDDLDNLVKTSIPVSRYTARSIFAINTETGERRDFDNMKQAARELGVDRNAVRRGIKNQTKPSVGYWWAYADA